jgi:hypothetical protein
MDFRIMYLRNNKKQPIGCLAVKLDRAKGLAFYNFSIQNPIDDFDRSIGRQLALGRMVESPLSVKIEKDANMHEVSYSIMTDLIKRDVSPIRAVKAAKHWLKLLRTSELIID